VTATKLMLPEVEVLVATDPGRDPEKQVNEDACRCEQTPFGHLLVVCDGMGGHAGGREASHLAVETVFRYVAQAPLRPDIPPATRAREVLRDAIGLANREVYGLGAGKLPSGARPGSTIVAVLVHALGTEVAHVGDSRCLLAHEGQIRQLTRDHSMVQQLVDAGRLSAEEVAQHPEANKITRALGMSAGVEVEIQRASTVHVAGDVFIACSDGLSDLVTASEVLECLARVPFRETAQSLVALANSRGGNDNITVALMRTREHALVAAPETAAPMALRMTEEMPAVAVSPLATTEPISSTPQIPGEAPSHPLLPPAPPPSRRAKPRAPKAGILAGLVLLLVSVGAIVAFAFRSCAADSGHGDTPSPGLSIVLPAASLEHGTAPDDDSDAGADAARAHRFHKKTRK